MIGAKQFTKRIQHRLNEVGALPFKKQWQVTLLLDGGGEVKMLQGDTIVEALDIAQRYLDAAMPGKTL